MQGNKAGAAKTEVGVRKQGQETTTVGKKTGTGGKETGKGCK